MHASATTIWKAALENVLGLPSCPNDMSHPAYASLIFENTCQVRLSVVSFLYSRPVFLSLFYSQMNNFFLVSIELSSTKRPKCRLVPASKVMFTMC
jgi:hypothetical protein